MTLRKFITGEDKLPPRVMKSLKETGEYWGLVSGILFMYDVRGNKIRKNNLLTGKITFYDRGGVLFFTREGRG